MDKFKLTFYRFSIYNYIVTGILPLITLWCASLSWHIINSIANGFTYIFIAVMGGVFDIIYQYRCKVELNKSTLANSSLSKFTKLGLFLILLMPMLLYTWFGYLFVSSDNSRVGEPNQSELMIQELDKEFKESREEKSKKAGSQQQDKTSQTGNKDVTVSSTLRSKQFTPDLNSETPIHKQFQSHTMKVFQLLDPRAELSTEELEKSEALTKELIPLMAENNWSAMIELADKRSESMPELVEGLMQAAGILGAPLDVYLELANRGGKMSAPGLLAIINRGELNTVVALESHGSSIQDTPFPNTNMLHFAMLAPIKPQAFEYVIERVEVLNETSIMGVDTIGIAIINASANPANVSSYIKTMLHKGGTIKPQHLQLMAGLKRDEPSLYEEIAAFLPELQVEDNG